MAWSDIISDGGTAQDLVNAAADIAASEMVKILDYAIRNWIVQYGQPVASISIAGKSHSLALTQARDLREYYRLRAIDESNDGSEILPQEGAFYDA